MLFRLCGPGRSRLKRQRVSSSILDRWQEVLSRGGNRAAVFASTGSPERTYADIEEESLAVKEALTGLPHGAVVTICARNHPAWPALILGVWKAGCCALLADSSVSVDSLVAAERRCGSRARLGVSKDGSWKVEALENPPPDFGTWKPELIKLTSGTTAEPRPILFSTAQLEADCENICETMGIGADDVNYGIVAFSHSYGFSNLITPLLCRGIPLVAANDAMPRAIAEGLRVSPATVLPSVPAIFQALAGIDEDLAMPRLCISAGAPLRAATVAAFQERFERKIHSFYGASECGAICYDAGDEPVDIDGFVGQPMKGVELLAEAAGDGAPGAPVRVRSGAVCLTDLDGGLATGGVFHPPDLLAPHRGGWRIAGRTSDTINVAGRKVNPAEVERVLLLHPGVSESAVFGVPDTIRGEMVVAWVVAREGSRAEELMRHCAGLLAPWQTPREIRLVESLPVTARGKLSRRDLRKAHLAAPEEG